MDSEAADVESLRGGLSLVDPLLDQILGDAATQLQGWLRVYGKTKWTGGGPGGVGMGFLKVYSHRI